MNTKLVVLFSPALSSPIVRILLIHSVHFQNSILTLGDSSLDAILQYLLQGVIQSTDGCGVQHLYQVGHLSLGRVIGDGVVPGVGHTLPVDAEHACGLSVQLARACLDVILCVVLSPATCTCRAALQYFDTF